MDNSGKPKSLFTVKRFSQIREILFINRAKH